MTEWMPDDDDVEDYFALGATEYKLGINAVSMSIARTAYRAWLEAFTNSVRDAVRTVEEINGTHVREVVFDGHSDATRPPARALEDFGLAVHLWDGAFTGDLGDGRAGWLSATVETGRQMVTVRHGETLRVLVDQTGRATGVVVPVDYGEEQDNGTAISGTD